MATVHDLCSFLEGFAPTRLAEDWDNVGLLIGDGQRSVAQVMTCLTVTPATVAEAVEMGADLIVTHHPFPFRSLKRLTHETVTGQLIMRVIEARVAVHSPHTAFDSAARGINQRLAEVLGLIDVRPLVPRPDDPDSLGAGRFGRFAMATPLADVAKSLQESLGVGGLHQVGKSESLIAAAAIACGSAGEFLGPARELGCDLLVTGETSFHTCLEAEATGVALLLPGHYASERFAVEQLAAVIAEAFSELHVWASEREADPLTWVAG